MAIRKFILTFSARRGSLLVESHDLLTLVPSFWETSFEGLPFQGKTSVFLGSLQAISGPSWDSLLVNATLSLDSLSQQHAGSWATLAVCLEYYSQVNRNLNPLSFLTSTCSKLFAGFHKSALMGSPVPVEKLPLEHAPGKRLERLALPRIQTMAGEEGL